MFLKSGILWICLIITVRCDEEHEESYKYVVPEAKTNSAEGQKVFLEEPFNFKDDPNAAFESWVLSKAKKSDGGSYNGKWAIALPESNFLSADDVGLVMKTAAGHHAITKKLSSPFSFKDNNALVFQYEVRYPDSAINCGGQYVKLYSSGSSLDDLSKVNDVTPYTVMFGPDLCGDSKKVHLIIRFRNPKTGVTNEHHFKKFPTSSLDKLFGEKAMRLLTLVLHSNDNYDLYLDNSKLISGDFFSEGTFDPPFIPPEQIDDPNDFKPSDWDEREKIPDPESSKPDDWDESQPEMVFDTEAEKPDGWLDDEPAMVNDPDAEKPDDWDSEMDGEYEPPQIENPKCQNAPGCGKWERPEIKNPLYKGKWHAPMIANPKYQGVWTPRKTDNPAFFEMTPGDHVFSQLDSIDAVGFELWTMSADVLFDNILLTNAHSVAAQYAADSYALKKSSWFQSASVMDALFARPWVTALVVLFTVVPLILGCVYCCTKDSVLDQPLDPVAFRKKFDSTVTDRAGSVPPQIDEVIEDDDFEDDGPPQLEPVTPPVSSTCGAVEGSGDEEEEADTSQLDIDGEAESDDASEALSQNSPKSPAISSNPASPVRSDFGAGDGSPRKTNVGRRSRKD